MISKYVIIIFIFLVQSISLFSQDEKTKIEERYYDIDSTLVFKFDSVGQIVYYYKLSEKKPCVNIQFKGGHKSFSAYCDSLYYNRDDYNYDELNAQVMYTILFNHNLKIKEIKIIKMKRKAYTNDKYNYDDLVKRILLSTEGKWFKTNDDECKWYFRFGYFNLR